uniref:Uncharacterized protein n=1 Tax=Oryza barthii TaxID=65489 RepID=A0A0D3HL09_9ORYZ
MEDCHVFKTELARQLAIEKGKQREYKNSTGSFPDFDLHVSHIFGGSTSYSSKREYKKVEREVCSTSQGAATKMKWSQHKIEFSESDHLRIAMSRP